MRKFYTTNRKHIGEYKSLIEILLHLEILLRLKIFFRKNFDFEKQIEILLHPSECLV